MEHLENAVDDLPADQAALGTGRATTGLPRWVKVSLLIVVALVALFVIASWTGLAGNHGPARHDPSRHGLGTQSSLVDLRLLADEAR